MSRKTWYSIDVSGNDRHICSFTRNVTYFLFTKVEQYRPHVKWWATGDYGYRVDVLSAEQIHSGLKAKGACEKPGWCYIRTRKKIRKITFERKGIFSPFKHERNFAPRNSRNDNAIICLSIMHSEYDGLQSIGGYLDRLHARKAIRFERGSNLRRACRRFLLRELLPGTFLLKKTRAFFFFVHCHRIVTQFWSHYASRSEWERLYRTAQLPTNRRFSLTNF